MHGIYCPIEEAKDALAEQGRLRARVEAWWGDCGLPPFLDVSSQETGVAVAAKQVATGQYDDLLFDRLARRAGLRPLWMEYTQDQFSVHSSVKRSLVHRLVCFGRGRNGGMKLRTEKFVPDLSRCIGRRLCDITDANGQSLIDMHHALQDRILPGAWRVDAGHWFHRVSERASGYYDAFLSLFVAHGVLFDDYHDVHSGPALPGFTKRVFEPAYCRTIERFGVPPLIVRVPCAPEYEYYPGDDQWAHHGILPPDLL